MNIDLIKKYLKEIAEKKQNSNDKEIVKMLIRKGLSRREIYYCFPPSKSINSINSAIALAKAEIEREKFYSKNKNLYRRNKNENG